MTRGELVYTAWEVAAVAYVVIQATLFFRRAERKRRSEKHDVQ